MKPRKFIRDLSGYFDTEYKTAVIGKPKKEVLADAGIDIRRANEAEII